MKELIIRTISGLIGVILLILIASQGGIVLDAGILFISIVGVYEFYKALNKSGYKPIKLLGYIFCILLFLDNINIVWADLDFGIFIVLIISLLLMVVNNKVTILDVAYTLMGILYVPFLMFHITYLDNTKYIWLIFLTAWGTDTFAYIFGNLFGKNKLCPDLSPNKTIEGSLGGILGSIILTTIFSKYFKLGPMWKMILLSIIASILAQFGDLTASKIKRITGIKDYGYIMPGHGGILDRFDSILFTAPVVYYYVKYFIL
ncbi:phosphatidate cytidylyltransferase [Anaerosalibacter sp. Marseille-P3206]|uniref:phosphatidate cytidylyltransferase n=1 Tax=Anaerosalibacter sp. Marseille-P3206 TaxID=1871005 RepID=UPI0009841699|nr:phosphatidate cytidylyltransferase [Anaerosalibacter sp. Marseille-P3206]